MDASPCYIFFERAINASQTETASTLRGLIKAVKEEAGVVSRSLAFFTSPVTPYAPNKITLAMRKSSVFGLQSSVFGLLSSVFCLQSSVFTRESV